VIEELTISELSITSVAGLDLIRSEAVEGPLGRTKFRCSFCWNEIVPARPEGFLEWIVYPLIRRRRYDCEICDVRFYRNRRNEIMLFAKVKVKSPKRFSDLFFIDSNQALSFQDLKRKLRQVQLERLGESVSRRSPLVNRQSLIVNR
jgi:hypothetical protein